MSDLRTERHATREEIADYLREFANQLDGRDGDVGGTAAGSGSDVDDHRRREGTDGAAASADAPTGTGSRSADADVGESADANVNADDRTGTTPHPAGKVTLLVGNDSATINPPRDVTFGVEVGSDSSLMSGDAEVVEFRMHWDANDVPEDDELRIE